MTLTTSSMGKHIIMSYNILFSYAFVFNPGGADPVGPARRARRGAGPCLSGYTYIYIYIYIYVCVCIYIYVYIYIYSLLHVAILRYVTVVVIGIGIGIGICIGIGIV